jgi:superfamily II DNA or RNA helicase
VIKVKKLNEVYLKIEAEAAIRAELSDYFSFEVPGYKFTPQYRNRVWDGKIRLYSYATGQLYVGLYPYLQEWCSRKKIEIVEINKILTFNTLLAADIDGLVKELELSIIPRDYQIDAFIYALQNDRGLILSPTASGKSLISYMLVKHYLRTINNKILIIVPTTNLVEQLFKDFKDYGFDSENNVSRNYHGYEIEEDKRVVISTWQSLYKLPKTFFANFGAVIGDEAHLFKAVSLTKIMTKLVDCKYRIGMTGTLDGTRTHKLVLEGLFGRVNQVTNTKELMDTKQLAKLKVICLILNHTENNRRLIYGKKYHEELEYLTQNSQRNKYIQNLCLALDGNTLCLFQLVEKHGKQLYEMIRNKADNKRKVFFIYGGVETDVREQIRAITEKSDNAIIVASYGTFSTGINIRNLHNIIFSSPSKSRIRNLQSIGRGLRIGDNKTNATLYDIADDLTYKGSKNYTLNHFQERIKLYNEEGFDYEIHSIDLKESDNNINISNGHN